MLYSEYYWLDRAGQGSWTIRHQITKVAAGTLHFNATRYILSVGRRNTPAGEYNTLDDVMAALYGDS